MIDKTDFQVDLIVERLKEEEEECFQDECGLVVLDVCQRVPYGVLCFMPSYRFLNMIMTRWMSSGLWQQLNEHKSVFFEEQNSANFQNTIGKSEPLALRSRARTVVISLQIAFVKRTASNRLDLPQRLLNVSMQCGNERKLPMTLPPAVHRTSLQRVAFFLRCAVVEHRKALTFPITMLGV